MSEASNLKTVANLAYHGVPIRVTYVMMAGDPEILEVFLSGHPTNLVDMLDKLGELRGGMHYPALGKIKEMLPCHGH